MFRNCKTCEEVHNLFDKLNAKNKAKLVVDRYRTGIYKSYIKNVKITSVTGYYCGNNAYNFCVNLSFTHKGVPFVLTEKICGNPFKQNPISREYTLIKTNYQRKRYSTL